MGHPPSLSESHAEVCAHDDGPPGSTNSTEERPRRYPRGTGDCHGHHSYHRHRCPQHVAAIDFASIARAVGDIHTLEDEITLYDVIS